MVNVLLGITGSVATIYTNKLIKALFDAGHVVNLVTTTQACFFSQWQPELYAELGPTNYKKFVYYHDGDEWNWEKRGDAITHISLRDWADVLVIAPLSANSLAKITNGICDNLLTSIVRAWDYGKPLIVCPACNTMMWENEPTQSHIEILQSRNIQVIPPVVKTLACGDTGIGAMCSHEDICKAVDTTIWGNPLKKPFFLPKSPHPGSFGAVRKHDRHTGCDIYCNDGDAVYAMEDGDIVTWLPFTGSAAGFPFWEDTSCVMVAGKSGVINYGEIVPVPRANPMGPVRRGEHIANVKRVLKLGKERPDIPHHSLSMLHVELYRLNTSKPTLWMLNETKPRELLNPTSRLEQINATTI